jgi:hypothetical protein
MQVTPFRLLKCVQPTVTNAELFTQPNYNAQQETHSQIVTCHFNDIRNIAIKDETHTIQITGT